MSIFSDVLPNEAMSTSESAMITETAKLLCNESFAFIPPDFYSSNVTYNEFEQLIAAQLDYYRLQADPHGGGRYRAYSRYYLAPGSESPVLDESNDYMQSPEYNYDDGGAVRRFAPLTAGFRNNPLTQHLLQRDYEIARSTALVDWTRPVIIGLHQVRYHATPQAPAISSPVWLHRDDEPVVFVHLLNLSACILGGDNLISSGDRRIDRVIRLTQPLDTLVLSQKVLHAVTPIGTNINTGAFRDVLLITFSNETKQ